MGNIGNFWWSRKVKTSLSNSFIWENLFYGEYFRYLHTIALQN